MASGKQSDFEILTWFCVHCHIGFQSVHPAVQNLLLTTVISTWQAGTVLGLWAHSDSCPFVGGLCRPDLWGLTQVTYLTLFCNFCWSTDFYFKSTQPSRTHSCVQLRTVPQLKCSECERACARPPLAGGPELTRGETLHPHRVRGTHSSPLTTCPISSSCRAAPAEAEAEVRVAGAGPVIHADTEESQRAVC